MPPTCEEKPLMTQLQRRHEREDRLSTDERSQADLLLDGGVVLTMDEDRRVFADGAVAVEGDRIVAVGSRSEVASQWTSRQVIDTRDSMVLPGLVCTHSHGWQVLFRGLGDDLQWSEWLRRMIFPLSLHLGADEAYVSTLLCCMDLMKTGSTTFSDCFYVHVDPEAFFAACAAAEDSGIRAVMGRASLNRGLAPAAFKEKPSVALQRTEEALRRLPRHPDRRVHACVQAANEHATSGRLVRQLKALADDNDAWFHMHAAETRGVADEIRRETGKGVFDYLDQLGAVDSRTLFFHAIWTQPHEIGLLKRRGASVSHNPVSNSAGGAVAPIPAMLRKGITVGLGVDGAASNNGQDMLETMKFTALVHPTVRTGWISAEQVLEMATIEGARALGLQDEIGSLEVGKKADVIVIRRPGKPHLSPGLKPVSDLVYCANGSDVDTVIVDGTVVIEDRSFTNLDEAEAMRKVDSAARAIIGKSGRDDLLRTPRFTYIDDR